MIETHTQTEARVRDAIQSGGIQVVVFWAQWCSNSISQLTRGLAESVEQHEDVGFTFVSLWDEGRDGAGTLRDHGVPARALVLGQPGVGEEAPKELRRKEFLGLPVTWIPTTWVFREGHLAYAFNYGEVTRDQLDTALSGARNDW